MNPICGGTVAFSWLVYVWDSYLARRQKHLIQSSSHPPEEVRTLIDDETFAKSRLYQLDKANFAFYSGLYSQFMTTLLILGGLPLSWYAALVAAESFGYSPEYELTVTGFWIIIFTLFNFFNDLPWGIYSTFFIEERHGFNKQTLGFFIKDHIKKLCVWTPIVLLITLLLIYIIKWGGQNFFLYASAFVFVTILLIATIYPSYIAPLFDKFTPLPDGDLRKAIEELASSLKFPLTKLYVVDGSKRSAHSNAYFYGFFKNKRIVLFDTLLEEGIMPKEVSKKDDETHQTDSDDAIEKPKNSETEDKAETKDTEKGKKKIGCNSDEVLAILSHEFGHWQFNHVLKNLALSQANILLCFFIFGILIDRTEVYVSFGFEGTKPTMIGLVIVFQFIFQPYNEVFSFILTQLTRYFEFQADAFARGLNRTEALKSALTKLYKDNLGFPIADPLYAAFNHSHPSLVERLRALKSSQKKED
eukprot:m.308393 g.308393  ORF g.308393 m.308393 type:complete len:473 (+) comp43918_c0_seq1:1465-2883(+)